MNVVVVGRAAVGGCRSRSRRRRCCLVVVVVVVTERVVVMGLARRRCCGYAAGVMAEVSGRSHAGNRPSVDKELFINSQRQTEHNNRSKFNSFGSIYYD